MNPISNWPGVIGTCIRFGIRVPNLFHIRHLGKKYELIRMYHDGYTLFWECSI